MRSEIHVVIYSVRKTLLWNRWADGIVLLEILARHVPFVVITVMPDHVHVVLPSASALPALFQAMKVYSQYLGRVRGAEGRTWSRRRKVEPIRDQRHLGEVVTYVLRNAIPKGLASDPLEWPVSVYRDMLGLSLRPLCPANPDPEAFHARVSTNRKPERGEPRVGTPFPGGRVHPLEGVAFREVAAAVSSLARLPLSELSRPGKARDLLFQATRRYCRVPLTRVTRFFGLHRTVGSKALARPRPTWELDLVGRVLGDERLFLMGNGDLRTLPRWAYYRKFSAPGEPSPGRNWRRAAAWRRSGTEPDRAGGGMVR